MPNELAGRVHSSGDSVTVIDDIILEKNSVRGILCCLMRMLTYLITCFPGIAFDLRLESLFRLSPGYPLDHQGMNCFDSLYPGAAA